MTLAALLGELRHRSVLLDPRGDDLRCLAPKGALTPELRRSIAENKPAILSLLGALGGNGRLETTTAASTNLCLHRLFEAQARRTPDTVAVVSDGEHVSYGELQRHAARLAHVLRTSGVHQETTVAIQNSLSVDTLVAVLAVLGAGGACVPIDPEEPPESVSDHAELAFSLVEKNRAANLVAESTTAVVGDVPSFGDGTRGFHLAYVLSTAGTGGERKWVQLEHRVLADVATFLAWKLGVGEMDVVFADAPFSSDRATLSMWLALVGGARLALASSEPELRDPARLAADLTRSRATLMFETPSRWRRLLSAGWNGRRGIRAVSSGEILDSTLARRLESFGIGLWNVYGCVETANLSAIEEFRPDNGGVAVGGPAPGTDLYVLDDELQPAPVEVGGDLYVGGGSIARGYAKQPDSTAKHFIPDPFARREGARLFRTGDRARWLTDGTLQVLGRAEEFRHVGGMRAEPRLVEDLLRGHPHVLDVAAAMQRHGDHNGSSLNAYVVSEDGDAALPPRLNQFLRGKLSAHLLPAAIYPLGELPLTRGGRVDRAALGGQQEVVPKGQVVARKLPGEDLDELCQQTNLTKNQLLVWMGQKLQPDAPLYNIATLFTITGPIERSHMEIAFQALVDASDALRTVVEEEEGVPRQRALPPFPVQMEYVDFSQSSHPREDLERWAGERSRVPFQLDQRLFYTAFIKLSDEDYALYLVQHHFITDAWSVSLVFRQLEALYRQSVRGVLRGPPTLPAFADFVSFERQKRETEAYQRAREYWRSKLGEDAETLEFYGSDVGKRTTRIDRVAYELGIERSERVKALAQEEAFSGSSENLSRFVLFTTVMCAYLHRISGNRLLSVGTMILNRPSKKFKETIGLFMQVAPLRFEISATETFSSLASKVKAEMRESMRYQRYATGNSAQQKVYDVLLNYETANVEQRFNGFPWQVKSYKTCAVDSLAILVRDYGSSGSFGLDFDYRCDLFSPDQQQQTWRHFQRVLASLLEDPDRLLSEVSLVSDEEREHLLVELNRDQAGLDSEMTVLDLFEAQVNRVPDSVAVVFEEGQLSYAELNRRASRVGEQLRELGVGPEATVGVSLPRSVELIVAVLGVLKSGGAYLPIDPSLTQQRREFMLRDARSSVVVTSEEHAKAQPLQAATVVRWESLDLAPSFAVPPAQRAKPDNAAYVIYTSGSTGRPKGVVVAHQNLANAFLGWQTTYELKTDPLAHLQMANFSFDVFAGDLVRSLLSGGRLIICPQALLLESKDLYEVMRRERVQIAEFVPVVLRGLIQYAKSSGQTLDFMRCLVVGSDTWYVGEHEATRQLCGADARLIQSYGVTEATIDSSFFEEATDEARPPEAMVPIGRPFPGMKIHIVDGHGHPAPLGIHGELCIGGRGVARGYFDRPELTAQKFVPDPFGSEPGRRLYCTGDLARYLDDGAIQFLGRRDLQVKLRGFRVELGEIEAVLVQHPEVSKAVVVARDDGSGVTRLIAYLVPEAGATLTIGTLRSHLKEQLSDYMLPSAYVALDALPLTPSGKVDRQALPIPDPSRIGSGREYVAPRSAHEKELARIWSEVLAIERVGLYDDFFELGGHSLLAIQLVSRTREAFGVELPLARLLENPSVAGFAQIVEESLDSGREVVVRDLGSEAVLESDITSADRAYRPVSDPGAVFLTGASGFLGAFLLRDLLDGTKADVYCLVRARSSEEGKNKLRDNLRRYFLWEDSLAARVVPVLGDLSLPRLGLSADDFGALARKVDVIYHSGAWIHALYPYSALKGTNVSGTHEVLRLGSESRLKPVHHVSTLSVFPLTGHPSGHVIRERDVLDDERPVNGYSQSKWVAEKLVTIARSRGLPVAIYRPGLITGDSRTGASNSDDIAFKLLKACLEMGSVPIAPSVPLTITPVDYVSRAIVHLSRREGSLGGTFHVVNPEPIGLSELFASFRQLGYPLEQVRFDRWRADLLRLAEGPQGKEIRPLTFLFSEGDDPEEGRGPRIPTIDCRETLEGLKGSSIECARADAALLGRYFGYFVRTGELQPPAAHPVVN